jgi:hypothetical protein
VGSSWVDMVARPSQAEPSRSPCVWLALAWHQHRQPQKRHVVQCEVHIVMWLGRRVVAATTQVRLLVWICLGEACSPVNTPPLLNDCKMIQLSLSSAVLLHPLKQRRPNHGSFLGEKKNKEKPGRQTHECLTFRRHDPPEPCDGSRACV